MKDPYGHGSNTHGVAKRGIKLHAINAFRKNKPSGAVIAKLLRQGSGHKSNPVPTHDAHGGAAFMRGQEVADRRY